MRQDVAEDVQRLTDWIVEGSTKVCNEAYLRGEDPPWGEVMDLSIARRVRMRVRASMRAREAYEKAVEDGWRPKVPTVIEGTVYCFLDGGVHDEDDECHGEHGQAYVWMEKQ